MKYETPELTPLTSATHAIQGLVSKQFTKQSDHVTPQAPFYLNEHLPGYVDWE
jgi:alcohol dehydrogenase class IV